ncbi:FGFR3 [Cordylochernes scorpioides]|uniref:receptor protein-tyrosine kinase n=1 Tax=Cordylochernes scorpioides TaxID=51811 RepID=A0ABY6JWA9_9ARAC|nr:FGFR3 [Cordylochernes scorpioides]
MINLLHKMDIVFISRTAGTTVKMKCPAVGNPSPTVSWLKDGQPLSERYHGKKMHLRRWSLVLEEALPSDKGEYTCIVSNIHGSINWTYTLEIQERIPHKPIFVSNAPENTTAILGSTVTFDCKFLSDLQPDLAWLRHTAVNGSFVDASGNPYIDKIEDTGATDEHPFQLVLNNVTMEDEGWYTCLVRNTFGWSYRSAWLTVIPDIKEAEETRTVTIYNPWLVGGLALVGIVAPVMSTILLLLAWRYRRHRRRPLLARPKKSIIIEKYAAQNGAEPNTGLGQDYELPLDPKWEFPRKRLTIGKVLGEGAFGKVVQADAYHLGDREGSTTVAIKMLKGKLIATLHQDRYNNDGAETCSDLEMVNLVSEMEVMKRIGKHVNIINMLGCCTQGGPLFVIVEYAPKGNLRDYLRSHRTFLGYERPIGADTNSLDLKLKDLVSFAYQVSKGMQYLSSRGCIHRDLAARNVLVCENNVLKIADFGLARDIQNMDYYKKNTHGRLPFKWMPPEALFDRIYTYQSDVWSYGVLLWEIMTLGGTPYPSMPTEILLPALQRGYRMDCPEKCPVQL